jgi:hypothetical protein
MVDKVDKLQLLDWMKKYSGFDKRSFSNISINNINRRLLEFYKGQHYKVFNNHLRIREKSTDYNSLRLSDCVHLICEELKIFNQHSNKIVYRNELIVKSFDEIIFWFSKNKDKVISFPSFLSCSKKPWHDYETILTIRTKSNSKAYDVSSLQTLNTETEVIFLPNTAFRILNISESTKTIELIETEECSSIVLYEYEGFYSINNNCDEDDESIPSLSDLGDGF